MVWDLRVKGENMIPFRVALVMSTWAPHQDGQKKGNEPGGIRTRELLELPQRKAGLGREALVQSKTR